MTDSTCRRSFSESRPPARASSLSRISSASARSEAIVGTTSSDACQSRKRSASSATTRSAPRRLAAAARERLLDHGLEVVDVVEEAAVEPVDRRVEVARNGEVDEQQRPALARAQRRGDRLARDDEARRARRRRRRRPRARARRRPRRARAPARRASAPDPRRGRASGSRRRRSRAPRETRFRAVASLILPAPSSSTRRPSSSPNTCCASAAAADGTDAGLSPIAVSTRTRRPVCSACRKRRSSSGPGAPASNALRTWPRISPSPGTSESSPAATRKRCSAAASSRAGRARRRASSARSPASSVSAATASLLGVVLPREVELGAVARREDDRLAAERELRASARHASRSSATRSRSSIGARWCETPTSVELRHDAKWVRGRTTATSAKPARLSSAARRPRHPSWRSDEQRRVDRPDTERDRHRRVEVAALEARERRRRSRASAATSEPSTLRAASRSSASSGGTRSRRTPRSRRFEPALLPEIQRRHPGGERQAGEAGEHQRDVDGEHGTRAVARRRARCRRPPTRARAARPRPASPPARAAGSAACSPRSGTRRRRARRRG